MNAWLQANPFWTSGTGLLLLLFITLATMVFVAVRRNAGSSTYAQMAMHLISVVLVAVLVKKAIAGSMTAETSFANSIGSTS